MRDPERIDEIVNVFKTIWKTYPDMRLTQLMESIISSIAHGQKPKDQFYVEDDITLQEMKDILKTGRFK